MKKRYSLFFMFWW